MIDGYYRNSLWAWKDRLQKDHRKLMARYASLDRQCHPSTEGQGKLIELNRRVLEMVSEALAEADAALTPRADGGRG